MIKKARSLSSFQSAKPGSQGSLPIGFEVDDLDFEVTRLKEKGVTFRGNVLEDGAVRIAFFSDLDDNKLYLAAIKKNYWS